jgi:hypothetical protein
MQQPKKPLPPVATTASIGVLLTAFVMAGVPAAILTYQDFASGNHDAASLLAIFGLALLSAISATGALTIHNKTTVPPGVADALNNVVLPALANLTNGMNATLSHVAQPPPQAPIHINNIMPATAPQAPVQPVQSPSRPIPIQVPPLIAPEQLPQFIPYSPQAANTFNLPAQPMNLPQQQAADGSNVAPQSATVPAMLPSLDPAWNDSQLMQVIPTSKQA